MRIKKEWFTEENLQKFKMTLNEAYTLPRYVVLIRDSANKEGKRFGLKESVSLISEVKLWGGEPTPKDLFFVAGKEEGNTLFKVNPEFNWNEYAIKKTNDAMKEKDIDYLNSLLKINDFKFDAETRTYRNKNGICVNFSVEIKDVNGNIIAKDIEETFRYLNNKVED